MAMHSLDPAPFSYNFDSRLVMSLPLDSQQKLEWDEWMNS